MFLVNCKNKSLIRRFCGVFALLLLVLEMNLDAQNWAPTPRHLTVEEGLPTLDTYHVAQDKDGFIWIGTDLGVAKYNGYDFEVMTTRDGLTNNDVIRIVKDRSDRLWLSSLGPLVVLDGTDKAIVETPERTADKLAFELVDTPEGGMWINFGKYIYYLNPDRTFEPLPLAIAEQAFVSQGAVIRGHGDTVLICNGTRIYKTLNHRVIDSLPLPFGMQRKRNLAYVQGKKYFYFVTNDGLQSWDPVSGSVVMQDATIKNSTHLCFEQNQLFTLHLDYGLKTYDLSENGLKPAQHLRPADYCNAYFIDDEGNLWLTTLGSGVFIYPRQTLSTYSTELPKNHRRINKLLVDNGQLYLGTYNGRIYVIDQEGGRVELLVESIAPKNDTFDRIMAMVKLSTGELLVGKDTGLYLLKDGQLQILSSLSVKSLFVDKKDNLLVTTQRISARVNHELLRIWLDNPGKDKDCLYQAETLTTDRSYAVFVSKDGTIWFDNTKKGFTSYRDGKVTYWKERSGIFRAHINDIEELPDSTLVIASQGEGLVFIKNDDYWEVDEEQQLPSNIINALHISGDNLWVATNRGVALINHIDIANKSLDIDVYNRSDGLMTEDIADLVIWKNELMLATELGLLGLPLARQVVEEISPKILLQSMAAGGDHFAFGREVVLPSHSNNVDFKFLGISYRSDGKIRYRYRLQGHDEQWLSTANREVRYHNLSPGAYAFMVQAIDYKGQVSEQIFQAFSIQPHFTQRKVFWLFMGLLSLGILWAIAYAYLGLQQKNRLALLVREKTADLDAQIVELARSNEELEQFARAASHDLKSPLRNVASFVQLLARRTKDRLDDEEKEFISLAVQGVKRMERIIEDLLRVTKVDQHNEEKESIAFSQLITQITGANEVLLDEHSAAVLLDTDLPELVFSKVNAYQLLQNLIVNAITYRSVADPQINIGCVNTGAFWEFYVRDNGIGVDVEFQKQIFDLFERLHHNSEIPGTGIGLAICKKIVERNGGSIWVESVVEEGSTFYFTIPKEV